MIAQDHRELILEGPGQKKLIYQLAECIQLKPVQATSCRPSNSVHSKVIQRTVLPTERFIVYFILYRRTICLSL